MKTLFFLLFGLLAASICGQTNKQQVAFEKYIMEDKTYSSAEAKNEIIKNDLSALWLPGENSNILGFIGENYQRLQIRFLTVVKDKNKPDTYLVTGKTKVKGNINSFSGNIVVTKVRIVKRGTWGVDDDYQGQDLKDVGVIFGSYKFAEDKAQTGSGTFQGTLATYFIVKKDSKIFIDNLMEGADAYFNNQFAGTWKSYKTGAVKTANWGEDRIPFSGDLDQGTGEFSPEKKYWKSGWQSYHDAYSTENEKALLEEEREWWK